MIDIPAHLEIATAPWFGFCKSIDCDKELGWPKPELVGRLLEDEQYAWLCFEHLRERVRAASIRNAAIELGKR